MATLCYASSMLATFVVLPFRWVVMCVVCSGECVLFVMNGEVGVVLRVIGVFCGRDRMGQTWDRQANRLYKTGDR